MSILDHPMAIFDFSQQFPKKGALRSALIIPANGTSEAAVDTLKTQWLQALCAAHSIPSLQICRRWVTIARAINNGRWEYFESA
jgi:hypothetical protein